MDLRESFVFSIHCTDIRSEAMKTLPKLTTSAHRSFPAGGVKSMADARAMVEAGATRIGASVGVKIAQEAAGVKSNGRGAAAY